MEIATVDELKRDFKNGHLTSWKVETKGAIWVITFKDREEKEYKLVDARNQETREFASLHAAVSAIEEVGFEYKT
jgi:hypothetical protein